MDGDERAAARRFPSGPLQGRMSSMVGMGEKLFRNGGFHPDRIAGRILGMGDVLSLVEKAQSEFDAEEAEAMRAKCARPALTLKISGTQMRRVKKTDPDSNPGKCCLVWVPQAKSWPRPAARCPKSEMTRMEAMINSMTMEERRNPDIPQRQPPGQNCKGRWRWRCPG